MEKLESNNSTEISRSVSGTLISARIQVSFIIEMSNGIKKEF